MKIGDWKIVEEIVLKRLAKSIELTVTAFGWRLKTACPAADLDLCASSLQEPHQFPLVLPPQIQEDGPLFWLVPRRLRSAQFSVLVKISTLEMTGQDWTSKG